MEQWLVGWCERVIGIRQLLEINIFVQQWELCTLSISRDISLVGKYEPQMITDIKNYEWKMRSVQSSVPSTSVLINQRGWQATGYSGGEDNGRTITKCEVTYPPSLLDKGTSKVITLKEAIILNR
ncbi:hypothetical protein CBL_11322 [Carabus blaptoides fortunei]